MTGIEWTNQIQKKYCNRKRNMFYSWICRIRYFDTIIFIPNLIFLLFILVKWLHTRAKLNSSKPLLLSVCCLILTVSLINILRCLFSMIFHDAQSHVKGIILKVSRKTSSMWPGKFLDSRVGPLVTCSIYTVMHRIKFTSVWHLFWYSNWIDIFKRN